jgi:hypothetical protein
MAVFRLRVFDVAVTFGLMVLLSKYKVLTALPLWWHPWQEAAVLLLPSVILMYARQLDSASDCGR